MLKLSTLGKAIAIALTLSLLTYLLSNALITGCEGIKKIKWEERSSLMSSIDDLVLKVDYTLSYDELLEELTLSADFKLINVGKEVKILCSHSATIFEIIYLSEVGEVIKRTSERAKELGKYGFTTKIEPNKYVGEHIEDTVPKGARFIVFVTKELLLNCEEENAFTLKTMLDLKEVSFKPKYVILNYLKPVITILNLSSKPGASLNVGNLIKLGYVASPSSEVFIKPLKEFEIYVMIVREPMNKITYLVFYIPYNLIINSTYIHVNMGFKGTLTTNKEPTELYNDFIKVFNNLDFDIEQSHLDSNGFKVILVGPSNPPEYISLAKIYISIERVGIRLYRVEGKVAIVNYAAPINQAPIYKDKLVSELSKLMYYVKDSLGGTELITEIPKVKSYDVPYISPYLDIKPYGINVKEVISEVLKELIDGHALKGFTASDIGSISALNIKYGSFISFINGSWICRSFDSIYKELPDLGLILNSKVINEYLKQSIPSLEEIITTKMVTSISNVTETKAFGPLEDVLNVLKKYLPSSALVLTLIAIALVVIVAIALVLRRR